MRQMKKNGISVPKTEQVVTTQALTDFTTLYLLSDIASGSAQDAYSDNSRRTLPAATCAGVSLQGDYPALRFLAALRRFLKRVSNLSGVTSVPASSSNVVALPQRGALVSDSVSGSRVQGRTPRSFLKAISGRLLEKVSGGNFDRYERENYRLAALLVEAVRDGQSNPYEFCIAVHYGGLVPKPSPRAIPFNVSPEVYFQQKEESGKLPEHVGGRDSKSWVASVVAYLNYRLTSTTSDRNSKLQSPYFDALIVVDRQQRGLELPLLYRRRSNSTEQPTVIPARVVERPALVSRAAKVLA